MLSEPIDLLDKCYEVETLLRAAVLAIENTDGFEGSDEMVDAVRLVGMALDAQRPVTIAIDQYENGHGPLRRLERTA